MKDSKEIKIPDISFEDHRQVPKYQLIIDAISDMIRSGDFKKGDRIPSLNAFTTRYGLSQDTVLTAYNDLKSRGVITSSVGKGYYVHRELVNGQHRLLLLFDKLTPYKEELYEGLKRKLFGHGSEQLFFHHNQLKVFRTILDNSAHDYTEFVIMPMSSGEASDIINALPRKKVFILDQGRNRFRKHYACVCQDFEGDIYRMLKAHTGDLDRYKRLVLVVRRQRQPLNEIRAGFSRYCTEHDRAYEVTGHLESFGLRTGDLYIVVDDRDLEFLVNWSREHQLELGVHVGIISYNETPLKSIVASGITTISTDFAHMGSSMAEMIITGERRKIDNPFIIRRRASF